MSEPSRLVWVDDSLGSSARIGRIFAGSICRHDDAPYHQRFHWSIGGIQPQYKISRGGEGYAPTLAKGKAIIERIWRRWLAEAGIG